MKPHIHAKSSAEKFGGKPADYLAIHQFIDSSKAVIADHRHRALTHNTWFISEVLPRVFGDTITNSKGDEVSVRDIGEQHVLEDFRGKFIPSAQDWLNGLTYAEWMNNGAAEPESTPKPKLVTPILQHPPELPSLPTLPYPTEPFDDGTGRRPRPTRPEIVD